MTTVRSPGSGRPSALAVEFDTFSVAVGLAIIAGGLALVAPYLDALTAALAALATAGWAAGHARERAAGTPAAVSGRGAGLLCVVLGVGAFFLLPGPLVVTRGLALALSFVPIWWVDRRRHSRRTPHAKGAP